MKRPQVGILALQGCVTPHIRHIEASGSDYIEVRHPKQLKNIDALILPGGESSTFLKLINFFHFEEELLEASKKIPFWGICAGSILMAAKVTNPEQKSFSIVDVDIRRNGYGRQLDSFETRLKFIDNNLVAFIRAPVIERTGKNVNVLGEYEKHPVWVEEGRHILSTFHPELSLETPSYLHKRLISKI